MSAPPREVDQIYERIVAVSYEGYRELWDAFWRQRYAVLRDQGDLISLYAAM